MPPRIVSRGAWRWIFSREQGNWAPARLPLPPVRVPPTPAVVETLAAELESLVSVPANVSEVAATDFFSQIYADLTCAGPNCAINGLGMLLSPAALEFLTSKDMVQGASRLAWGRRGLPELSEERTSKCEVGEHVRWVCAPV
jgi:hypothetical protein